ncbi:hypothetical protein [Actinophytocola algeriensis]|uniref:Uncharacterized protein n=1 Tax=Actinophytocola algeriensis TaxID=1768010 RepID=A0A7W7Q2B9_9PSEU|nr:hypothetical protein [Actinophytocola algeriensis]MBB4905523.1 hypothetical protein [Actinophytocola algeriensis]MBE1472792.1 hypothetical protein [Actinophytocola algeriensis]
MVRRFAVAACTVAIGVLAPGCSLFGPTTKNEVCAEFDELGERYLAADGFIDNLLFIQAGALADVADRYDGTPSLGPDAEALEAISDSDSTDGLELMAATAAIAELCGHVLGRQALIPGGSGFGWGDGSADQPDADPPATGTPDRTPPTTGDPPATADEPGHDLYTVSGPGGLALSIPAGWVVGGSPSAANQQAAAPGDDRTFVRFGASTPPSVPLLTEIQNGESGNPNVRNGYQRIRLAETYFLGQAAVDWEFTFVKDGVTRHAFGRYWRQNGLGYVIYLSAPDTEWSSARWVFDAMATTATVY